MSTLRSRLIRLAHENPRVRPHILPLLTKRASSVDGLEEILDKVKKIKGDPDSKDIQKGLKAITDLVSEIRDYAESH